MSIRNATYFYIQQYLCIYQEYNLKFCIKIELNKELGKKVTSYSPYQKYIPQSAIIHKNDSTQLLNNDDLVIVIINHLIVISNTDCAQPYAVRQ